MVQVDRHCPIARAHSVPERDTRWDFRLEVLPEYVTTAQQSRQMVFLWSVIVPVSSAEKPKCFQTVLFVLKLGFTIRLNSFTVDISVYAQTVDKQILTTALSDNC